MELSPGLFLMVRVRMIVRMLVLVHNAGLFQGRVVNSPCEFTPSPDERQPIAARWPNSRDVLGGSLASW
jgi:hypothetical protein